MCPNIFIQMYVLTVVENRNPVAPRMQLWTKGNDEKMHMEFRRRRLI